jgi:hypothetical protein
VGPRAGLDGCVKSRPTGIRSPDRPARSKSLYRLSYPGPHRIISRVYILSFEYGRIFYTICKMCHTTVIKVKLFLFMTLNHIGVEVWLHSLLFKALHRDEWPISHPQKITSGNEPRYALNRKLGGPQSGAEHLGEKKTLLSFCDTNPGPSSP